MKKVISLFFAINSVLSFAQSGQKWATGGNNTSAGDFLGTSNNFQLDFKTNNVLRMSIGANGGVKINNLAGTGNRFLQTDANGNLVSFSSGLPTQVLYGNGVWGNLPVVAPTWSVFGNNMANTNTGDLYIGSSFIFGSGTLKNSAWISSANRLMLTDVNGYLTPLAAGNSNQVLFGNGVWGNLPSALSSFTAIGNVIYTAPSTSLGIGTNNPQFPLDVIGDARIGNNLYVGGGIVITDHLRASESVTTSVLTADTIKMGLNRSIEGRTFINGDLYIAPTRTLTAQGDVIANNKLSVNGNASFNGSLRVSALANGLTDQEVFVDPSGNLKTIPNYGPGTGCKPTNPAWRIGGNIINGSFNDISAGTCNNYPYVLKANNINRLWISEVDGTIGFGTADPSNTGGKEFKFDAGAVRLSGQASGFGAPTLIFDWHNTPGDNPYGVWGIQYIDQATHAPKFAKSGINYFKPYGSSYSFDNILFLADDGTIGMGTDNPSSRLTLDAWSGDGLIVNSSVNTNKAISLNYKNGLAYEDYFNVYGNGYTEIKVRPSTLPKPYGATVERALTIRDVTLNKDLFVVTAQGKAYAREVEINLVQNFPDFVFAKDYKLKPLSEVDDYIKKNQHLPNFEKGEHYEKNGINVTDLLLKQQQTIEELMLYNIDLEKRLKKLEEKK